MTKYINKIDALESLINKLTDGKTKGEIASIFPAENKQRIDATRIGNGKTYAR